MDHGEAAQAAPQIILILFRYIRIQYFCLDPLLLFSSTLLCIQADCLQEENQ